MLKLDYLGAKYPHHTAALQKSSVSEKLRIDGRTFHLSSFLVFCELQLKVASALFSNIPPFLIYYYYYYLIGKAVYREKEIHRESSSVLWFTLQVDAKAKLSRSETKS